MNFSRDALLIKISGRIFILMINQVIKIKYFLLCDDGTLFVH